MALNHVFKNYASAVAAVCKAIDAYNQLRPHMSVSNLTPAKAHTAKKPLFKIWKRKIRM